MSFAATHIAPEGGLRAWATPGTAEPLAVAIDPGVPLQVTDWSGAWAQIVCDNGWTAWVDGRLLLPVHGPGPAPAPASPPAPAPIAAPIPARPRHLAVDGFVGATLSLVAIFVPWIRIDGADPVNATDLPVGVLVDSLRGFDLALLVLALAVALCVPRPAPRLAAAAGLTAVAALFALQVDPKALLGPGVLVVLAGAAAGAPFQLRQGTPGS